MERGEPEPLLRGIERGEELTCNYLTTDWELHEKFAAPVARQTVMAK
jgi:hypothetical protein